MRSYSPRVVRTPALPFQICRFDNGVVVWKCYIVWKVAVAFLSFVVVSWCCGEKAKMAFTSWLCALSAGYGTVKASLRVRCCCSLPTEHIRTALLPLSRLLVRYAVERTTFSLHCCSCDDSLCGFSHTLVFRFDEVQLEPALRYFSHARSTDENATSPPYRKQSYHYKPSHH